VAATSVPVKSAAHQPSKSLMRAASSEQVPIYDSSYEIETPGEVALMNEDE
jgi:hypothetical protein